MSKRRFVRPDDRAGFYVDIVYDGEGYVVATIGNTGKEVFIDRKLGKVVSENYKFSSVFSSRVEAENVFILKYLWDELKKVDILDLSLTPDELSAITGKALNVARELGVTDAEIEKIKGWL